MTTFKKTLFLLLGILSCSQLDAMQKEKKSDKATKTDKKAEKPKKQEWQDLTAMREKKDKKNDPYAIDKANAAGRTMSQIVKGVPLHPWWEEKNSSAGSKDTNAEKRNAVTKEAEPRFSKPMFIKRDNRRSEIKSNVHYGFLEDDERFTPAERFKVALAFQEGDGPIRQHFVAAKNGFQALADDERYEDEYFGSLCALKSVEAEQMQYKIIPIDVIPKIRQRAEKVLIRVETSLAEHESELANIPVPPAGHERDSTYVYVRAGKVIYNSIDELVGAIYCLQVLRSRAYLSLGRLYHKMQDRENAIKCYEEANKPLSTFGDKKPSGDEIETRADSAFYLARLHTTEADTNEEVRKRVIDWHTYVTKHSKSMDKIAESWTLLGQLIDGRAANECYENAAAQEDNMLWRHRAEFKLAVALASKGTKGGANDLRRSKTLLIQSLIADDPELIVKIEGFVRKNQKEEGRFLDIELEKEDDKRRYSISLASQMKQQKREEDVYCEREMHFVEKKQEQKDAYTLAEQLQIAKAYYIGTKYVPQDLEKARTGFMSILANAPKDALLTRLYAQLGLGILDFKEGKRLLGVDPTKSREYIENARKFFDIIITSVNNELNKELLTMGYKEKDVIDQDPTRPLDKEIETKNPLKRVRAEASNEMAQILDIGFGITVPDKERARIYYTIAMRKIEIEKVSDSPADIQVQARAAIWLGNYFKQRDKWQVAVHYFEFVDKHSTSLLDQVQAWYYLGHKIEDRKKKEAYLRKAFDQKVHKETKLLALADLIELDTKYPNDRESALLAEEKAVTDQEDREIVLARLANLYDSMKPKQDYKAWNYFEKFKAQSKGASKYAQALVNLLWGKYYTVDGCGWTGGKNITKAKEYLIPVTEQIINLPAKAEAMALLRSI